MTALQVAARPFLKEFDQHSPTQATRLRLMLGSVSQYTVYYYRYQEDGLIHIYTLYGKGSYKHEDLIMKRAMGIASKSGEHVGLSFANSEGSVSTFWYNV